MTKALPRSSRQHPDGLLLETLSSVAQLLDDIKIRFPGAVTDWGDEVREQVSERLGELYTQPLNDD